jgi:hypothetical protein
MSREPADWETEPEAERVEDDGRYMTGEPIHRDARDVLADRISQWADSADWHVYDYADRLIADLDAAGFDIVRDR